MKSNTRSNNHTVKPVTSSSRYIFLTLTDGDKLDSIYNSGWMTNCVASFQRLQHEYNQCEQEHKKLVLLIGFFQPQNGRCSGLQGFVQVCNPPVQVNSQTAKYFIPFLWKCSIYVPFSMLPERFTQLQMLEEMSAEHGRMGRDELLIAAGYASVDRTQQQYNMLPPGPPLIMSPPPPQQSSSRPLDPRFNQSAPQTQQQYNNNKQTSPSVKPPRSPQPQHIPIQAPVPPPSGILQPEQLNSTLEALNKLNALIQNQAQPSTTTPVSPPEPPIPVVTPPVLPAASSSPPINQATVSTLSNYDTVSFQQLLNNIKIAQQKQQTTPTM